MNPSAKRPLLVLRVGVGGFLSGRACPDIASAMVEAASQQQHSASGGQTIVLVPDEQGRYEVQRPKLEMQLTPIAQAGRNRALPAGDEP